MNDQNIKASFFGFLQAQPRNIFLIDGFGASLSALFILGILAQFPGYVGLSREILLGLGGIAVLLCTFSFSSYFLTKGKKPGLLFGVISANLLYALLTFSLLLYYRQMVSALGMLYFISELFILGLIIILEYNMLRKWLAK